MFQSQLLRHLCDLERITALWLAGFSNSTWEKNGRLLRATVPNLFGTRDWFHGRQFFHGLAWGWGWFGGIQAHCRFCAFYFGGSDGNEPTFSAGDTGSIPGSGRCPGEGNGYPLQYPCLENSMDRGAWRATVYGVTKESDTTEPLTLNTLFLLLLLLLHQLPLRSSGIISQRLGAPASGGGRGN